MAMLLLMFHMEGKAHQGDPEPLGARSDDLPIVFVGRKVWYLKSVIIRENKNPKQKAVLQSWLPSFGFCVAFRNTFMMYYHIRH